MLGQFYCHDKCGPHEVLRIHETLCGGLGEEFMRFGVEELVIYTLQ